MRNNTVSMKKSSLTSSCRPQVWQKALFMLVMMLWVAVGAFAQSYTYSVSKTDVICDQDAGSVTLTITNQSAQPNGHAQLRTTNDPDHVITTETGSLDDDVVSDVGNNTWSKT
jgi:P pilus assembly chaperone PapD